MSFLVQVLHVKEKAMFLKKTNRNVVPFVGLAMGLILVLTVMVEAQPAGWLLVPSPLVDGQYIKWMHEYNLATGEMTLFPDYELPQRPLGTCLGPDGLLYVAIWPSLDGVLKLDPVTGETIDVLSISTVGGDVGLLCLPNGNLLLYDNGREAGKIWEYKADGTEVGEWADAGTDNLQCLRLTPKGTVAFVCGHPAYSPTKLVEYDLDGLYLRDVIPPQPDGMYDFDFASDTEILVVHLDTHCIKRYNWATGAFVSDFVCDCDKVGPSSLVVNSTDGSVYGGLFGNECAVDGCIWGWDANGTPLYEGEPLGCYGFPAYHGDLIILCSGDEHCQDSDVCTWDQCIGAECVLASNTYGDVNCDGVINIFDLLCVLRCFAGDCSCCCINDCDIHPCVGNDTINIFDLLAVLGAFAGNDPCCGGLP